MAEQSDVRVYPWKPGQSGNPAGRPPKARALTDLLDMAGRKKMRTAGGKLVPRNAVVAELLWEAATLGRVEMPDGLPRVLAPKEWIDVVKFLYSQIDGPPKPVADTDELEREAGKLSEELQLPKAAIIDLAKRIQRDYKREQA